MEGLIFGGAYLRREICVSKSIGLVFALFYFVFEGNFPITSPQGAYIWRDDLTEGFLRYWFGGLISGGAYFRNFTVLPKRVREDIAPQGRDINGNFVSPTIQNQGPYLNPRTFQDNYY